MAHEANMCKSQCFLAIIDGKFGLRKYHKTARNTSSSSMVVLAVKIVFHDLFEIFFYIFLNHFNILISKIFF